MTDGRTMQLDVDVLIVGAGPVGLMLANQLGLRGVRTLVVERNASTVHEPRAIGYDDETFRALQSVGLDRRFADHVVPDLPIAVLDRKNRPLFRIHMKERPYGHSWFGSFYQPTLEKILAEGLDRFDSVELRFEHELLTFEQRRGGVDAEVRDAQGERTTVRASWLIGCDGGASGVRRAIDVSFEGSTYQERWLVVDCVNDPVGRMEANFLCDTGRPTVSLPSPEGRRRWEFLLHSHESAEEMDSDETVSRLLSAYHDPELAEIERRTVYTFHARAATRFRVGRVLLAGDAAHVMPPFAGQGMNSGIRDAFNLGWKLALVVKGRAAPALIDSYEQERRWHVRKMTQLAVFLGWLVMPTNPVAMVTRDLIFFGLNRFPPSRNFLASGKLRPAPSLGKAGRFCPSSCKSSGKMLSQIEVRLPDGRNVPMDDLFGDGFAVIGVDADPLRHQDAWAALATRLDARSICIHTRGDAPTDVSPGPGTLHVTDTKGLFNDERYRNNCDVLVRPDRFIMVATNDAGRVAAATNAASLLELRHTSIPETTVPATASAS